MVMIGDDHVKIVVKIVVMVSCDWHGAGNICMMLALWERDCMIPKGKIYLDMIAGWIDDLSKMDMTYNVLGFKRDQCEHPL